MAGTSALDSVAQPSYNPVTLRICPAKFEASFWDSPVCQRCLRVMDILALTFAFCNNVLYYYKIERALTKHYFTSHVIKNAVCYMAVAALVQLYVLYKQEQLYKRWRWHIFCLNRVVRIVVLIAAGWCVEDNIIESRKYASITLETSGATAAALKVIWTVPFAAVLLQHAVVNILEFRTMLLFQVGSVLVLLWLYVSPAVQSLALPALVEGQAALPECLIAMTGFAEQLVTFRQPSRHPLQAREQQIFLVVFTQLYFGCVVPLFVTYQVELSLKMKICKRLATRRRLLSASKWLVLWSLICCKAAYWLATHELFQQFAVERWQFA